MAYKGESYELTCSESERDLGVQIQPDMKWKSQTQICVNKASRVLGMLKNTFESRGRDTKLYTAYVRPHLEFAVQAWSPPNITEIMLLEKVQRRASKIPFSNRNLNYEDRLGKMGLTSLELRRKRGDLIEFYKYINKLDLITLHQKPMFRTDASIAGPAACTRGNSRRVRSQSFTSREINDYCASVSVRMNFFTNRVAGWWNVLPNNIIEAKNLNAFKARLDEWLVLNNRKLF